MGKRPLKKKQMSREETLVHVEAYAFESSLDLRSMCERLNTQGPFRWAIGDSDTFGDYLISWPFSDRARLRIVEEEASWPFRVSTTLRRGEKEGSFIFDIEFKSEALNAAEVWEKLHATVTDEFLPLLLARNVRETINLD